MNYQEAIIIPLDVFRKCNFNKLEEKVESVTSENEQKNVLYNKNLPSDIKIKLHKQQKKLIKKQNIEPQVVSIHEEKLNETQQSEDNILEEFSNQTRPAVYFILKYIKESRDIVSWNDNLEVIIEGETIENSNIIELLKFVTNTLIITSSSDIPVGVSEFISALQKIGVPRSLIKIPRKSPRKKSDMWVNI